MKNSNVVDFQQRQETREQALERLFNEHGASLRSFLRGRLGATADIEDVVQEVFLRLARMPDLNNRMPPNSRESRAFIFTAANNLIVDLERHKAIRRRHQESERHSGIVELYQISPDVTVAGLQELNFVEQEILNLPAKWRKAFVLHRFGYMSCNDIARQMGTSKRTVENYINSALVRIRAAVSRVTGEE